MDQHTKPVRQKTSSFQTWRRKLSESFLQSAIAGLGHIIHLHPAFQPKRHQIEVLRDIPYTNSDDPSHTLDIYRPTSLNGPLPTLLYIHGGGFQLLSKDTHAGIAIQFAKQGFVVFNINYRLAPKHPYPSAVQDACEAYRWVKQHTTQYNGDPEQIVLAGESAGANISTALAIACSYPQTEPWARDLWEQKFAPKAVIAGCGIHQVSDPNRLSRRRHMPEWIMRRVREVTDYLPNKHHALPGEWTLADPLVFLERAETPPKALPPFFAFVGTRDPLLDDTRRLKRALDRLKTPCETKYYQGGIHAFHAFVWSDNAAQCWRDQFDFLKRQVQQPMLPPHTP